MTSSAGRIRVARPLPVGTAGVSEVACGTGQAAGLSPCRVEPTEDDM
ncbi:MAG: hypothetical protein GX358_03560 [candidate division WS1 bacterium]|nr:hypothetical protein [candidate division WS1 bacterium]